MVSISSSMLKLTAQPRVAPFQRVNPQEVVLRVTGALEAIGTVTFAGGARDRAQGWSIGFLQAQISETNVAIYRGVNEASGSVFEDRAPAGMRVVPCFDGAATGTPFIFTAQEPWFKPTGAAAALPFVASPPPNPSGKDATVSIAFYDSPSAAYLTLRNNTITGQPNFLNELNVEFGFVTVLVARDPSGAFHYLHGFTWSVHWHQKVLVSGGQLTSIAVAGADRFTLGSIIEGRPTNADALRTFEGPRTTTCNLLGDRMQDHPQLRSVSGWPAYTPSR
jgi:hypothetical protein